MPKRSTKEEEEPPFLTNATKKKKRKTRNSKKTNNEEFFYDSLEEEVIHSTNNDDKDKNYVDKSEEFSTDDDEDQDNVGKRSGVVQQLERNPEIVGDLHIQELEKLESIPMQTHFIMKKDYKSALVLDIGSSFSKGCSISKQNKQKFSYRCNLEFEGQSNPNFAKTTLYYDPTMDEYSLFKNKLACAHEVQSIKRLFTVFEAQTVEVAGKQLSVRTVMIKFLSLLMRSISSLPQESGEEPKITKKFDCFVFTVPTETPMHVKQHYKFCVNEALKSCFKDCRHVTFEDIYVIEEYVLLYFNDISDSDDSVSMIVDIGHLTTDTTIITKDRKIIYANGEVSGVSIVHEALKKEGGITDSFALMKEIFDNNYRNLPPKHSKWDPIFKKACEEIATSLLDVIVQHKPARVQIYGAFVGCEYVKKIMNDLLNEKHLKKYIDNHLYLKDEFQDVSHKFSLSYSSNGGSALVSGACNLVENSEEYQAPLEFKREIPASITYPAFTVQDSNGKINIQLGKMSCPREKWQDTEIFLVKIRNTIDIDELLQEPIDEDNFKQAGIMEFERFAVVNLDFKEHGNIQKHFILVGHVEEEHVLLNLYYRKLTEHYVTHQFKIPRKGRMERIPVNDISKVFEIEDEDKTWYGTKYTIDLDIRGTNMHRIFKKNITELDTEDFKELLKAKHPSKKDKAIEKKQPAETKCIVCKKVLLDLTKSSEVIAQNVHRLRKAFNDNNIIPGPCCHDCYCAYGRKNKVK